MSAHYTDLLTKLNNEETCFDTRLKLAYAATTIVEISFFGKEQVIIDWLADCLHTHISHVNAVLKTVYMILSNEQVLTVCESFDASKLIEAFENLDTDLKKKHRRLIIDCLLLILKNGLFQRHCRFDIKPLCQSVPLACQLLMMTSDEGDTVSYFVGGGGDMLTSSKLEDLFECIHNIYRVTQNRSELKLHFVKSFIPSFLLLKYNFQKSERFQTLFEEVVIGEETYVLCEAFKSNDSRNTRDHIRALVKMLSENEQLCDTVRLNMLVFDMYVSSCLKKSTSESSHLSLFCTLAHVAGLELSLPYDTVSGSSQVQSQCLPIIAALTRVLQKHNIPLSLEAKEGTLSTVLTHILKQLISGDYTLSSDLLIALNNIFNVHPESVKQVFSGFIRHVVFVKKRDGKVLKSYNNLLIVVVKIFSDLNQLDTFFNLFFRCAFGLLQKECNISKLTCEMVLTQGFYNILAEKLILLNGNQLKLVIEKLEKTFSKDIMACLEKEDALDVNFSLLVKITSQLLILVFQNSHIFALNRWTIISQQMTDVVSAVQRFGTTIVNCKRKEFLFEFLQLVKIIFDVECALKKYIISLPEERLTPTVATKDETTSEDDLSKSHGFLLSPGWQYVSQLVKESKDNKLKHCWYNLLHQKCKTVDDPQMFAHLIQTADIDWLWLTLRQLGKDVPIQHMELYTRQLLGQDTLLADVDYMVLSSTNIGHSSLKTAINLQLIKQLSKKIPDKHSVSRSLVKLINVSQIIEHEADHSQSMSPEMTNMINQMVIILNQYNWNQPCFVFSTNALNYISRLVGVLTVMSPHLLKVQTQCIIVLCLFGLAYELKSEESFSINIVQTIGACLDDKNTVLPETLDSRVVLQWLVAVVPPQFPFRLQLMHVTVRQVVRQLQSQLDDSFSEMIKGDEDLLCALLESLEIYGKNVKNNENFQNLITCLIFWTSLLVNKKPKAKFLRLYTIGVKNELIFCRGRSQFLLPTLPSYVDLLFHQLGKKSVVEPTAPELIDLIFQYEEEMEKNVTTKMYKYMGTELCKTELCPIICFPTTVKYFFKSLPSEIFEVILGEIYRSQINDIKEGCLRNTVYELWNIIVNTSLDRDKSIIRQKMLINVLAECHSVILSNNKSFHPTLLLLLYSIAHSKSVGSAPRLIDLVLEMLEEVPDDIMTCHLPECFSVLDALLNTRSEIVFDMIPSYYQRIRKFTRSLVYMSVDKGTDLALDNLCYSSVNNLTRIIKSITDHHARHFARVSPYLIADILHMLTVHPVENSIKNEIESCLCYLLSICDQHSIKLLQSQLSPAETELFKVISMMYSKNYKYTGKI